jgi:hypothetical protein
MLRSLTKPAGLGLVVKDHAQERPVDKKFLLY